MCGVFAIVQRTERFNLNSFSNALKMIKHRGPDFDDIVTLDCNNYKIALGHVRLSILDVSNHGNQPYSDSKGRVLIYNGEIFNYLEVREELKSKGYNFNSNSDTEVLIKAYDYWGEKCVEQFNGFWSFVLLDMNSQEPKVLVSRDRLGIKPLYLHFLDETIIFSSEISPIYEYVGRKPEVDKCNLARQLFYKKSHDTENTIYKGIKEFLPAHNMTIDLTDPFRKHRMYRYWDVPVSKQEMNFEDAYSEFSQLIEDAVRIRLLSDRPISLTLSGGIDSSVLAVAIRNVSGQSMKAYTSYFPNNVEIDESHYAKIVAEKCNLDHELIKFEHDIIKDESSLTRHQELLYISFSMLVNWGVLKQIKRNGSIVVLNGQGGDELFLGYERYFIPYLSNIKGLKNKISFVLGVVKNSKLSLLEFLRYYLYFNFSPIREKVLLSLRKKLFNSSLLSLLKREDLSLKSTLIELQKNEVCGEQLRRLLRYDDRTASAFGLEGRPPFLDHRIVEFAFKCPDEFKIKNGWTKYLLRTYLDRNGLPEIAWRTHKLGYASPVSDWMNNIQSTLDLDDLQSTIGEYINPSAIDRFSKLKKQEQFDIFNLYSTAKIMDWKI